MAGLDVARYSVTSIIIKLGESSTASFNQVLSIRVACFSLSLSLSFSLRAHRVTVKPPREKLGAR